MFRKQQKRTAFLRVKQKGIALLAVLVFVAFAMPIVVILLSLTAVEAQFPKAEITTRTTEEVSNAGFQDFLQHLFTSAPRFLWQCDAVGARANDDYRYYSPFLTVDSLASFWIRYPFLQPAEVYDPDITSRFRTANSLTVYPYYEWMDLADPYCEPDAGLGGGTPAAGVRTHLFLAFMPFGKRSIAFDIPDPLGLDLRSYINFAPGDPWNLTGRMNSMPVPNQPLFNLLSLVNDAKRAPYEFFIAGDTDPQANHPYNPYERVENSGFPTSVWPYDPVLPGEGFSLPVRGSILSDPDTGRPLENPLPTSNHLSYDAGVDIVPTGFEVSATDEGSRFPLYDFYHNPDDGYFFNPLPNPDPATSLPSRRFLDNLNNTSWVNTGYIQQHVALGWLIKGFGTDPAASRSKNRALLSYMTYYDMGDVGAPPGASDPQVVNNTRDDYDGNGYVDEPMRPFPGDLKEIQDVNLVKDTGERRGSGIGPAVFSWIKHLVTLYSAPAEQLSTLVNDPIITELLFGQGSLPCTSFTIYSDKAFHYCTLFDLYTPIQDQPAPGQPGWPTTNTCTSFRDLDGDGNPDTPQDCLLAFTDTNANKNLNDTLNWMTAFGQGDGNANNNIVDPETFYNFLTNTNSTVAVELTPLHDLLMRYLSPFFPAPFDYFQDLLARRVLGHWAAWQYFFRYSLTPNTNNCFGINGLDGDDDMKLARYHGIADSLIPIPTVGPWFDPGNVTEACGTTTSGDPMDFPSLVVGVDLGCGFNPGDPPPCPPGQSNGILEVDPNDPYCDNLSQNGLGAGNPPVYPDCYQPLIEDGLLIRPAFIVPDRLPQGLSFDASNPIPGSIRLTDELILFEILSSIAYADSPYRTYLDSDLDSRDDNNGPGNPPDPFPVNDICDPQGMRVQVGASILNSSSQNSGYYEADGRDTPGVGASCSNPPGGTLPDGWLNQDPANARPLYFRGKININTAPFPVLKALFAKLLTDDVTEIDDMGRFARNMALSILNYREWFYMNPTLDVNDANQGSAADWVGNFTDGIFGMTGFCAPSLYTQFLQSVAGFDPYSADNPSVCANAFRAKLNFPNHSINPPFRNIAQLLDVAWEPTYPVSATPPSSADDPRDVIAKWRVLCLNDDSSIMGPECRDESDLDGLPSPPYELTRSAAVLARIDQDITVKSFAYRLESLGKVGPSSQGKLLIYNLGAFPPLKEIELVVKDETSLFTKYY